PRCPETDRPVPPDNAWRPGCADCHRAATESAPPDARANRASPACRRSQAGRAAQSALRQARKAIAPGSKYSLNQAASRCRARCSPGREPGGRWCSSLFQSAPLTPEAPRKRSAFQEIVKFLGIAVAQGLFGTVKGQPHVRQFRQHCVAVRQENIAPHLGGAGRNAGEVTEPATGELESEVSVIGARHLPHIN